MPDITFTLTLPDGPNSPVVIVAGGADSDGDGTIEDNSEVAAFQRAGNVWTRTQSLAGISGTKFFVTFTVGADVRWELVITDAAGKALYTNQNTTVFHTGEIKWQLP